MSLITDAREKAEASVPEKYRKGFDAFMAAGLKLMFSDKTFPKVQEFVKSIQSPQDIPKMIAHGITKLFSILLNGSKGKIPLEASGAALVVLMTHALDYLEHSGKVEITADIIAETTRLVMQGHMLLLKQSSGLTDDQFQQVLAGRGRELVQGQAPPMSGGM